MDLTAPIPNTSKIGVWRIEPNNSYTLKGQPGMPSGLNHEAMPSAPTKSPLVDTVSHGWPSRDPRDPNHSPQIGAC